MVSAVGSLRYVRFVVCVMSGFQFVLWAVFSLCYVRCSVRVVCFFSWCDVRSLVGVMRSAVFSLWYARVLCVLCMSGKIVSCVLSRSVWCRREGVCAWL